MAIKTHIPKQEETGTEKAVQMRTADPGSPVDDQTWINKTSEEFKFRDTTDKEIAGEVITSSLPTEGLQNYLSDSGKIAAADTEISQRAQINHALKPAMGKERISFGNGIELMATEFGANGEAVYRLAGDDRIRVVGSWYAAASSTGTRILSSADSFQWTDPNEYIEVTFYGTGLNLLALPNTTRDIDVDVDGSPITALSNPTESTILSSRNYANNIVKPIVSGLTLGLHTVRVKGKASNTAAGDLLGVEILNESSTFDVKAGNSYAQGAINNLASDDSSAYDAGVTGVKGGRVVKYLQAGVISQAVQLVEASQLDLAAADHSNEVGKKINFRDFDKERADGFSTLVASNSDRAFTLDDGITTLVGNDVQVQGSVPDAVAVNANGGFLTITFVGTGLDIIREDTASGNDDYEAFVDGNSIGQLEDGVTISRREKIVSGLPYGTHTVQILRNSASIYSLAVSDFIIYQPKKPAIPADAVELADYNVLADYVANTTAGLETIATGVIRKDVSREMVATGTLTFSFAPADLVGGTALRMTAASSTISYTFFGTGFEARASVNTSGVNVELELDGSTDLSGFTTSIYSAAGASFTAATGVWDQTPTSGLVEGSGVTVSGLALGLHTIKFTTLGAGNGKLDCLDIISPIHTSEPVTDSAMKNERDFSPVITENVESPFGRAKVLLEYDQINNIILRSYGVSAMLDVATARTNVYFEKRFKKEPVIIVSCSDNRAAGTSAPNNNGTDSRKDGCRIITRSISSSSESDANTVWLAAYGELEDE